ncbi:hypothetical protein GC176_20985 [bacterium]|nr:hypothetical protein [bacterium]
MNRESVIWSTRLCCAVIAVVISVGMARAQSSESPFNGLDAKSARAGAPHPANSSVPQGRLPQSPSTSGLSDRTIENAYYQVSTTSGNSSADPAAGSSIGLVAAAGGRQAPATEKRIATPLAPRSSLGLPNADADEAAAGRSGGFGSILIALGFVVVLMLGVAKVVQRRNPFAVTGVPREAIDVLGRRTIDPRNSIYIVRVGPKILLLGNSANGLTTLSEIADPIEVASLANLCRAASESPPTDLGAWFKGVWGRRSSKGEVRSFEDRFGERLMSDAQRGETGTVTSVDVARRQEARRV